ncbi:hypothetical protein CVT24_008405 [Panaeolus cyanescens]|uniref:Uncharacterized protein n=1 Tax=Panaeolus cyanescens TaxID=181874 RepID=A0A409VEU4_9AGAR|nr:hypothetical protein CVT24_008405 [Panaeolus cyanescens]
MDFIQTLDPSKLVLGGTFTALLGASAIFDIVWMFRHEQNGFIKFLTVCLLLFKLPTFFAFASAVRQRGGQFGGLGAGNISGPTVWSMPGGFTSGDREGYQTVEDDAFIRNVRLPTGPSPPQKPPGPETTAPTAPGAYQTV